ncbi:hypothetical protein KFK09_014082 [Dendrobium nobile]|uniref:Uncharacterized protein n=1 Tax=Dendrobium nobile TaxID=94219 RepID=A0A8T3BAQ1_DENNO|nr:hypothetical protein KFK09_014082 [Dendrobium nobile]
MTSCFHLGASSFKPATESLFLLYHSQTRAFILIIRSTSTDIRTPSPSPNSMPVAAEPHPNLRSSSPSPLAADST